MNGVVIIAYISEHFKGDKKMNKWELPKEPQFYNWESPITKIYGDIHNEIIRQDEENCMYAIEQVIGYKVDKEELIKALQYDREQYDKGYRDGVKEKFIDELEKVKKEIIERHQIECNRNCENCRYVSCIEDKNIVVDIKIIEKHISELKGE